MSTKTKTLAESINDARSNFGAIVKNASNPHYRSKYADLNEILDAVIPALTKEGILLSQPIVDGCVYTRLSKGDECIEASLPLPPIQDPQKIGSAITYYRRYTLSSLLALAAEDDDGNTAAQAPQAPKPVTVKQGGQTVYQLKEKSVEAPAEIYKYDLSELVKDQVKYDKLVNYLGTIDNWEIKDDNILVSTDPINKLKNYRMEA